MTKEDRLDYIKDALEQLYNDLEDINNDVDDLMDTKINDLEESIYGKYGINTRLQQAIDYLYAIQKDVDALDETEDD